MFTKLTNYLSKPGLDSVNRSGLYHALWDDEHISKGMLEAHLHPELDAASRNHAFLDRSAAWIGSIAPPTQYPNLLDLGCGPGLYAERFAKIGYNVTGLDFSKRSLAYAKEQTKSNGSNITYHYQNYLTMDYSEEFDLITLLYCDYAPFSAKDREILLKKVYRALRPSGRFIFDVFTPKMRKEEYHSWQYFEQAGFFHSHPHLLLEALYQYDNEDQTELCQHIVITKDDVICYLVPNHYFTKESILAEIEPIGFATTFYGDVAGEEYSQEGDTLCVVCTKK